MSIKYHDLNVGVTIGREEGGIQIVETEDPGGGTIVAITGQEIILQGKNATPSSSQQVISPDSGYTGLSSVTIAALPSEYIIPSGTKSITANGTDIDVSEYASVDVAVPAPAINLQAKTGISPTESSQTIEYDNGYDGLSSVQINAISSSYVGTGITRRSSSDLSASGNTITVPSGYYASQASGSVASGSAGTPTATKGTVSNHSITVTPSVTNTAGYISGGTKTGTAVTVSVSELESGTKSITANGTGISVSGYSAVDVAVPVGTSKNTQISAAAGRATSSTYTNTNVSLTVSTTGTYHVYWSGYRSSTSGTNGSQLYINGSAYGNAQTSFNSGSGLTNTQQVHLSGVSLSKDDVITIYARSRGNNYYMYVMNLIIIQA